jgi:ADP-ribosylglycohydrolase
MDKKDKIDGGIFGSYLGDALGATSEFDRTSEIYVFLILIMVGMNCHSGSNRRSPYHRRS